MWESSSLRALSELVERLVVNNVGKSNKQNGRSARLPERPGKGTGKKNPPVVRTNLKDWPKT